MINFDHRPAIGKSGRREQRREERVSTILSAAEEVFAQAGFSGATTAAVAARAGLPKPTVHYYFPTKEDLYRAVIGRVLDFWLGVGDMIREEADPAAAIAAYVRAKLDYSRRLPFASRVFANEVLHGAPHIGDYLRVTIKGWVEEKAGVLDAWAARGLTARVDADHFFFVLWAATQTYADFEAQIAGIIGRPFDRDEDWDRAQKTVTRMALATLGLSGPEPPPAG